MVYKKLSSILMTVGLAASANAFAVSTVDLSTSGQAGSNISFDLSINMDTPTISGWVDVSYNNALLDFSSTSNPSALWDFYTISDDGSAIELYFESVSFSGEDIDTLITLNFDVIGTGSDLLVADHHGASNSFVDENFYEIPVTFGSANYSVTAVPVPAAIWLFGTGLIGLAGIARRKAA